MLIEPVGTVNTGDAGGATDSAVRCLDLSSVRYRRFGRLGWQVSEIGYGMWGLSGWTGSDDARTRAALTEAVRLGCNFFDTAWAYGDGHSEGMLGELVRAHPDKRLYTASKIPPKNLSWPSRRDMRLDEVFPADPHP